MKSKYESDEIASLEDVRKDILATKIRIFQREEELRRRFRQVPGELFYSGVDSVIPSILTGRISSFALNAGKGFINNFFIRKAASASGRSGLPGLPKPSGVLRKIGSVFKAVLRKKK